MRVNSATKLPIMMVFYQSYKHDSSTFKKAGMRAGRGGRVVECTGLENQQGFTPFGGSNPPLSATMPKCLSGMVNKRYRILCKTERDNWKENGRRLI